MTEDQGQTMDAYEVSPLPEYKCHKIVKAGKIVGISNYPDKVQVTLALEGGQHVVVGSGFLEKHDPEPGGYYVLYGDGYESYSPGGVFEGGYDRIGSIKEMPKE